jgi:dipeptidyl aminopeptidase/acylaminoacyl peptidase
MRTGFWAAVLAAATLCLGLAAPSAAAPPPPPPLAAYGALPAISRVTLSDDGSRLAFVGVAGENRKLVMQTVEGQVLAVLDLGKSEIDDLIWAGNEDIIIVTSQTKALPEIGWPKTRFSSAQAFSLTKKRVANLSGRIPDSFGMIFSGVVVRQINGKYYAFFRVASNVGTPRYLLAKVAISDVIATTTEWATLDNHGWLVDGDGVAGARSRYNSEGGGWGAAMRRGKTGWPELMTVNAKLDRPALVAFSPDGSAIVVKVTTEKGDEYVQVSADGTSSPALPDDRAYEGILVDASNSRLMGAYWRDQSYNYMFFDPVAKTAWEKVMKTFKGQRVSLLSWTPGWQKLAVHVEGPENSGMYYLVDLAARRADIIGDSYPLVTPDQVAEVRPYTYKAADGREIQGYLTLPRGRDPRSLPLVVMPHGGPESHDTLSFDWWAQALASRGYAVLQPNFRGSTGYSLEHLEAGYGEWGRKMQTDLSDGVRALARDGLIDPKRVCIAGWSYGGYAALAGPTIDPGVYRCAVSMAGVSDLGRMLKWEEDQAGEKSMTTRYWQRFMGASGPGDSALAAISPALQASKAEAPILLMHGKDDTVVPYMQSVIMQDALKAAGKPVQLITFEGQDHDLTLTSTRLQMLEATVDFLLRHNPPD